MPVTVCFSCVRKRVRKKEIWYILFLIKFQKRLESMGILNNKTFLRICQYPRKCIHNNNNNNNNNRIWCNFICYYWRLLKLRRWFLHSASLTRGTSVVSVFSIVQYIFNRGCVSPCGQVMFYELISVSLTSAHALPVTPTVRPATTPSVTAARLRERVPLPFVCRLASSLATT